MNGLCDYVADKVITCSGCSLSFCLKCANVSKTLHQCIMEELENFHWSFRSCKATFPTLQQISSSLQDITGKHDASVYNRKSFSIIHFIGDIESFA